MPEGTSIMRAAMEAGMKIPKLCATDTLAAFGSCRVCLVEIEGRNGTPASCTTPVAPGMKVSTSTDRLRRLRRGVMELYLSDHPTNTPDLSRSPAIANSTKSPARSACARSAMAPPATNHLNAIVDGSNPYFQFDPAKCIVCSRCVRACEEVQGTFALTVEGRGFASKIVAGMDEPFLTSECVSCGACVQACPTGSLIEKSVVELGQPEHSVVTTCAYCGVGCSFKAEMQGETVVRMMPWKDGKANHGHSCVKGRFAWGYANHRDRILKPMVRAKITDPWREVSWEEAIGRVASEFKRIQAQHGRGLDRRHHLVALHRRRNLPGAEAGRAGVRQQQHRYLRAGLPLADRLRVEDHVRHLGRHAEFQLRGTHRRHAGGRRQSDRRAPGVRLAHEAAAARGRETHRGRSAPHRHGAHAACRGVVSPAAAARHQRRGADRAGACHRHRGPGQPGVHPRALRCRSLRRMGRLRVGTPQQPGGSRKGQRRAGGTNPWRGPAVRLRAQRRDLLRPRRHRAQPGQHRGDVPGQPRDG